MSEQTESRLRSNRTGVLLSGALLLIAAVLVLSACSSGGSTGDVTARWQSETSTEGGVTIVRTLGGSVWQGEARLVEEASIGSTDGPDEYLLGQISGMAVHGDRIYILDSQIPVVRVYDLDGVHLMDIGRSGGGPGEFREPRSLAVDPNTGRLFVRDSQNARVNIYSPAGDPLDQWAISSTFSTSRPLVATVGGELYTMQLLNPGSSLDDWQMGMCRLGPQGTELDTIPAPVFDFDSSQWRVIARTENNESATTIPYAPGAMWTMTAEGAMVGGVSEEYRFEVRWPDGHTTRIEKVWGDRVPVRREEAAWLRRRITEQFQENFPGWAWSNHRDIPGHKPPYSSLVADLSGRIWVGRLGPSVELEDGVIQADDSRDYWRYPRWRSTTFWEVFTAEGEFLGPIAVPENLQLGDASWIHEDTVVARYTDDDGVPYVKRYRIVLP